MGKVIKCISPEEIEIVDYKNPRVCFNDNSYTDGNIYCTLKEKINPFNMYYENKDLQQRIDKAIDELDILISNCDISEYHAKKIKNILKGDDTNE